MVYEIAEIDVKAGSEAAFEAGVTAAAPLFRGAKGCHSMKLHRSIENPQRYRLVVEWETVENHMVDFRDSPAFQPSNCTEFAVLPASPLPLRERSRAARVRGNRATRHFSQ